MRFRAEDVTPEQVQMLRDLQALAEEHEKSVKVAEEITMQLEQTGMTWGEIIAGVGIGILALLAVV